MNDIVYFVTYILNCIVKQHYNFRFIVISCHKKISSPAVVCAPNNDGEANIDNPAANSRLRCQIICAKYVDWYTWKLEISGSRLKLDDEDPGRLDIWGMWYLRCIS